MVLRPLEVSETIWWGLLHRTLLRHFPFSVITLALMVQNQTSEDGQSCWWHGTACGCHPSRHHGMVWVDRSHLQLDILAGEPGKHVHFTASWLFFFPFFSIGSRHLKIYFTFSKKFLFICMYVPLWTYLQMPQRAEEGIEYRGAGWS